LSYAGGRPTLGDMATRVDSRSDRSPDHADLGTAISRYLRDAEQGRVPAFGGGDYSPAGLRSLRRTLAHVEAAAGTLDLAGLGAMSSSELERLGRQVVEYEGLPPSRAPAVVDALRRLSTYTRTETAAEPPPRIRPAPEAAPPSPGTVRTPTHTMLALGAHLSVWIERIMVAALVLTVIGLALALA
jgi:hypothetical protein